jgi:hypothetical protein
MKSPDIVMITVIILKTVSFTLLHNMFRSMSINGCDMNKTSTEFNLNLMGRGSKTCHPGCYLVCLAYWPWQDREKLSMFSS